MKPKKALESIPHRIWYNAIRIRPTDTFLRTYSCVNKLIIFIWVVFEYYVDLWMYWCVSIHLDAAAFGTECK